VNIIVIMLQQYCHKFQSCLTTISILPQRHHCIDSLCMPSDSGIYLCTHDVI